MKLDEIFIAETQMNKSWMQFISLMAYIANV